MTHPTDRDEDYQRRTDAIKAVLLRNWPTMCDDGYDLGAVAHDLFLAVTPLPATPADDAVAWAREAFDRAAMEFAAILDHRDRIYGSLDGPVFVKAYRALLAAERAAKGNNEGGSRE